MSKLILVGAILCAGLAAACGGGGSGVSSSKSLVSLNDSEVNKLCEYVVDLAGPERTLTCSNGAMGTRGGGTVAECAADFKETATASPNCAATVGDAEHCAEDLADLSDAEICSLSIPSSCMKLFQCEFDDVSRLRLTAP
jgi:hypothetical protein